MAEFALDDAVGDVQPAPASFDNAGTRSIQSMTANATAERVDSTFSVNTPRMTQYSPLYEYEIHLWYNRFMAFLRDVLNVADGATHTPTGEDIVRFLCSIVGHLTYNKDPSGKVSGVTLTNMRSGMSCLTAALTFYYPNFSLSPHNRSRISSAMNTLLLNGEITRSTKQQKSWFGAFVRLSQRYT